MQKQGIATKPETLELSSYNTARASELIRDGKASLKVMVYPWGVEFAISSPCCQVEGARGGEKDGV